MSPKQKILVCGLYYSGSGAVTDLLSEYEGVSCVPEEFDDIRRAGMLGDHAQGKIDVNNPCNVYSASNGFWYPVRYNPTVKFYLKQLVKKLVIFTPLSLLYKQGLYSSNRKRAEMLRRASLDIANERTLESKVDTLKKYVDEVADMYVKDQDSHVIFDQPIFFNSHQDIWPKVFEPFKLIIVVRDPRDQLAQLIKLGLIRCDIETPTRGLIDIYGDSRLGAVRYELDTLKARYNNAKKIQDQLGSDKVKLVAFESLVRNYEEVKAEIEEFIGISPSSHVQKMNKFDPRISEKNIGLYQQYLTESELKLFENVSMGVDQ